MSDPARWTTAADIRTAVARRWASGSLLRAYTAGEAFDPVEVSLRGPTAADLGEYFDAARSWVEGLERGSRDGRAYAIVRGTVGGRFTGSTEVPKRATITTFEQAWAVLGAAFGTDAERFRVLVESSADDRHVRGWAHQHPLAALALADDWPAIRAAVEWLRQQRGSGRFVREVTARGVDTKFIERHRAPLAAMLGVPASASGFTAALGLSPKPSFVRLRFDAATLGMPAGLSEGVFRVEELRALSVTPSRAWIVENEVTYLSVPVPPGGVVLWGKGYDADEPASLTWLAGAPVHYWGDLDTHGFAILSRVRGWLPQARSFLMDRATLLSHEERWGTEPRPTSARLGRLDADEAALYSDLVTDRYGAHVRLEQERIDWEWVRSWLPE
jgi:hypothetical protein